MPWQRLSVRTGKREPVGPYEGVPVHLVNPLVTWMTGYFAGPYNMLENTGALRFLAVRNELPAVPNADDVQLLNHLLNLCARDQDFFLDVIDSMLRFINLPRDMVAELDGILAAGGSVWSVASDLTSLTKRVDHSAVEQFLAATSPNDAASIELQEAWSKAHGRNPDASDAWDHAIKAVEGVLIPIVCPLKDKANLGSVAGDLRAQPGRWSFWLQSNGTIGGVETLEAMLRLLWPNPDRHGGAAQRMPTLGEAQAAVQLAVTIVQWGRAGALKLA